MSADSDEATRLLARDVVAGAVAGAVVGLVLAVLIVVQDFPSWGEVVWSLTMAGLVLVVAAVLTRVALHLTFTAVQRHLLPQDRRPAPLVVLQAVRVVNLVAAFDLVLYLVLLATFAIGTGSALPDV